MNLDVDKCSMDRRIVQHSHVCFKPWIMDSLCPTRQSKVLGQWNIVRRGSVSCELVLGSCVNLTTACNVQVDYYPNIS